MMEEIAIIGLACRVPEAEHATRFWQNLLTAKDSVSHFSSKEIQQDAEAPSNHYVAAKGVLKDAECFDHEFFDIPPSVAKWLDPQQRIFLETCYHALEDSGYAQHAAGRSIGVFAGASFNTYLTENLQKHPQLFDKADWHQLVINNSADFLSTRVAYAFDLQGPAQTIQTACSSSLVAVHHACTSLLTYQCDMALAGGISITSPIKGGYDYKENSVFSASGTCRPFDENADGMVPGNGAGVVILKRLSDALVDNDHIYAVIAGSAINNDGRNKMSFAAPTAKGQVNVIRAAADFAGISPAQFAFVETHGTGTKLGDRIELSALNEVLTEAGAADCALTSTKANIGHLDAAAGVIGLIRSALSLHHGIIAPSANFSALPKELSAKDSAYYINKTTKKLPAAHNYAGVSSFGIGGTNAHAIIRSIPKNQNAVLHKHEYYILPLSAKSPQALNRLKASYLEYVAEVPADSICNVAYSLQCHRKHYAFRDYITLDTQGNITTLPKGSDSYKQAQLWLQGTVKASAIQSFASGCKMPLLPSYAFKRKRCWLADDVAHKPAALSAQFTAPPAIHATTNIAEAIRTILKEQLGVKEIDDEQRFEDMGIDSFLSIDLLCLIEERTGKTLAYETFMQHDSVYKLSAYIASLTKNSPPPTHPVDSSLCILLKAGDTELAPIFMIHPAGGSVTVFRDICQSMQTKRCIYGIQALPNLAASFKRSTIAHMAKDYLVAIQAKQPYGPYALCGSSMGGAVAYEIAALLQAQGEQIELLAMLDTPSPSRPSVVPETDEAVMEAIREFSPQVHAQLVDSLNTSQIRTQEFIKLWRLHHDSVFNYSPAAYIGQIMYFYATERDRFTQPNLHEGWQHLVASKGGFCMHTVQGNHITMHLAPHAKHIANVLSSELSNGFISQKVVVAG
ncbi:MAG: thioesterase domain-containing protein [Alphaproteobacteria bacterium]|nr:thioesterase domain-containing protein [Alphaproteobacteria bacterium]